MKIDSTTSVTGGGLNNLSLEVVDLTAVVSSDSPLPLVATLDPTTISISHMYIDSDEQIGGGGETDPDDPYLFYGRSSSHLGLGGGEAPTYRPCYPIVAGNSDPASSSRSV